MKAKSLGILSQDYESDKVANLESLHKAIDIYDDFDDNFINSLYDEPEGVPVENFELNPCHTSIIS
jgi:PhoH-like ATPase